VPSPRHPNADIEAALRHAEEHGWRVEVGGSHCWGRMYCPWNDEHCRSGARCMVSVWSTPRNPRRHVQDILRAVDGCVHVVAHKRRHDR